MEDPKKDIYTILKTIPNVTVLQIRPEKLSTFPCIVFFISNNIPVYSVGKDIETQQMEITVDIYAKSSKETGALLPLVEQAMRNNDYRLTFNSDIPEPEPNPYSHLSLKFVY